MRSEPRQESCEIQKREHGDYVDFSLYCDSNADSDSERGILSLMKMKIKGRVFWGVDGIYIDETHRRKRYGTKLYEAAAAFACSKGSSLASFSREVGAFSNDFWLKQERKGRASRIPLRGSDDAFVLHACTGSPFVDLSGVSVPKNLGWYAAGAAGLVALLLLTKGKTEPPLQVKAERKKYGPLLDVAAERHGIPTSLLRAVAYVESRWSPTDVSHKGAVGLLQLMPGTAVALGVTDRTDPAQSANGGAKFLADLYKKAGSWEVALAAYNWGPGNVFGSSTKMPSLYPSQWPVNTQQYVREIMAAQQRGVE